MKKLRVFLAVPVPSDVRHSVADVTGELATKITGVRWVEPDGIHVTLKFFGEVEELETVEISRCVQRVAARHDGFEIGLAGLGAFPTVDRPRTLWIGVTDGAEKLGALQTDLENEFLELGYKAESRRYHPHLTIGRVRDKSGIGDLSAELAARSDLQLGLAPVNKVVVYSSDLRKSGPIYTPLATCPLS